MQSSRKTIFEITKFLARYSKSASNWENFVKDTLGDVGAATGADRLGIFRFDQNKANPFKPEIFWTAGGVAPYTSYFTFASWLIKQLSDDKHVLINSADFTEIEKGNISAKSTLLFPIILEDSLWGCLIIEHFLSERSWAEEDIDALRIFSGILAISIEHGKAKDALHESEGLFELLSDFSEGILIVDWNGDVLYANKAMLKHADANSIKELKAANIKFFLHPETQASSLALLERAKKRSGGTFYDHKIITKQGEVKYLACAGTQILYKGKSACLISMRDVTKQRIAEEFLKEKTNELALANVQMKSEIAERKRAEEALKENEEFLRAIMNNMLDSVLILDRDGDILFGNNAAASLADLSSPEEGIGLNLSEFLHTDSLEEAFRNLKLDLEGKGNFLAQHKVITRKGHEKYIEAMGTRINFKGMTADIVSCRDVTERKKADEALKMSQERYREQSEKLARANQIMREEIAERQKAEEALRASETLFRKLVDNMLDCLLIIDLQGHILFLNDTALRIGEFDSLEDVLGKNVTDFLLPDYLEKSQAALLTGRAGETGYLFDYKLRTGKGNERHIEGLGKPIIFKGQNAFIINLRDITERKRVEEALSTSETLFRNLVENMLDSLIIIDIEGIILFANDAAFKLVEVEKEVFINQKKNFMEFLDANSIEKAHNALGLAQKGMDAVLIDFRLLTGRGNEKFIEGLGKPIKFKGRNAVIVNIRDITERKLAEAALKESEQKLADIIQFYPDATMVIDNLGKVILWNRAIEEMTGIQSRDIVGKGDYEYTIPFYGERKAILVDLVMRPDEEIETKYTSIRREGNILFGENYVPCLKGEPHYLVATAAKLHDHEGNIVGAIESIRDITAQKKLEEALRKSEENYRELVEKARNIIMRMDSSGRITFFNEYAEKFFGYSQKEILGRNVVGTIVPETENRRRDLGELLRDITVRPEKYTQYETESMCKDGRRVWISWTNAPVCNSDGKTSEILCIGNDVTERKIVERELREYRENLEELVQKRTSELQLANQQLGLEIVERKKSEEKIRSLNMLLLSAKMITETLLRAGTEQEIYQKTCELLAELDFIKFVWAGFIEKDAPGIKPVAWAGCEDGYLSEVTITWDDSKYGQGPLGKAIRTGTIHMVTDCETDPGFALWREAALKRNFQSIIALPIRYRDMVIGYFTVYSNRKNAFGAEEVEFLSQIAEDLAVGVKSLRLENELQAKNKQLQQAYAELKESEEIILQKEKMASIGQLAAGIAHEIKNPLAIILQGTDFVSSSIKDEDMLDSLERVKKSVFRADNIIKGLLSYARQSDLKPEIADISLLIDECISLIKHQLTKKKIDILRQYNTVPKVIIDSNQMKQVFINILMNSIESMDQGRIEIELDSISENNYEFTQIRLSDEGPGIQNDILKKIFDPFFTTKRNTGGTGLGLSITRGIIEKHNGGIHIDSELGAGTTVTITLPAQQLQ